MPIVSCQYSSRRIKIKEVLPKKSANQDFTAC